MIQKRRIQFDLRDAVAAMAFAGVMLTVGFSSNPLSAQQPHYLMTGRMAPGHASHVRLMANPQLAAKVQPVKIIGPESSSLSVVSNGSFIETMQSNHTAGMQLGSLYRFRINHLMVGSQIELYPSVELLDHLHPPAGLENEFPIPVVITESDLRHAMDGRLVTKVIYLEDSETALPRGGTSKEQPWIDVSAARDPVRAAEGLGRPMAILRIGSRIPTAEELGNTMQNAFNSAMPTPVDETSQPALRRNLQYQSPVIPPVDANTDSAATSQPNQ